MPAQSQRTPSFGPMTGSTIRDRTEVFRPKPPRVVPAVPNSTADARDEKPGLKSVRDSTRVFTPRPPPRFVLPSEEVTEVVPRLPVDIRPAADVVSFSHEDYEDAGYEAQGHGARGYEAQEYEARGCESQECEARGYEAQGQEAQPDDVDGYEAVRDEVARRPVNDDARRSTGHGKVTQQEGAGHWRLENPSDFVIGASIADSAASSGKHSIRTPIERTHGGAYVPHEHVSMRDPSRATPPASQESRAKASKTRSSSPRDLYMRGLVLGVLLGPLACIAAALFGRSAMREGVLHAVLAQCVLWSIAYVAFG